MGWWNECDRRAANVGFGGRSLAAALVLLAVAAPVARAERQDLQPIVNQGERVLEFDWPALQIGTAEYPQGPTGATVVRFGQRAQVAIDVRGGGPGTVNSDYIRLGYDLPELDAVVFAGGSWYGLEAVTAVSSALKDDGIRDGNAFSDEPNIALATGSIIFDFGARRLNEIYPDSRLAQAAFRAARAGRFPLGAQGAGRFAMTGGFFGCNAYSGQGAAFRQIGALKIAVFTVVNAYGVIVDRDGRLAACYRGANWPADTTASELFAAYPGSRDPEWGEAPARNTTVSLVAINQRLPPAELQRLAVQVHTSMARAIQPFATLYDGDVLYAASTQEVTAEVGAMNSVDIGVVASELMWDAILAATPEQPVAATPAATRVVTAAQLRRFAGEYEFADGVRLRITVEGEHIFGQAVGGRNIYAFNRTAPVEALAVSRTSFVVPGRYPVVLSFEPSGRLVINPGHWEQVGRRV